MFKRYIKPIFLMCYKIFTFCYTKIIQSQIINVIITYLKKYVILPLSIWFEKKKNIYITKRNTFYTRIQTSKVKIYMKRLLYTFPIYMIFFFTYAQTQFIYTIIVWLCYWVYLWCAIFYIRSLLFVFPSAPKDDYSLAIYLATWVILWMAPMIFYMYVYYPFWYFYQQ